MSVQGKRAVILCVDDEKTILETLEQQILTRLGREFDIELADSGEDALEIIEEITEDGRELAVLVSDQIMPGMKGDELLIAVHKTHPDAHKILLTGQASLEAVVNAINKARLYRYVPKPWEVNDLMMTIEQAAHSFKQRAQIFAFDQHTRLLKALNKASQDISDEIERKRVMARFLESVGDNLAPRAAFALLPDEQNQWHVIDHYASDPLMADTLRVQYEANPQRFSEIIYQRCFANSPQYLANPIRYRGKTLAYVLLEKDIDAEPFNQNHREMLLMLCSQAGISLQNAGLYDDLATSARDLQAEKEKVETMHQDLTESIQYAQRIQRSLLPPSDVLMRVCPASFIFYQPKDVVSGDFYWFLEENEALYIAVADCTGHGVPGALMAALGGAQLNEIVKQRKIQAPEKILAELHNSISRSLHQTHAKINDGMDVALCKIEPKKRLLTYAGANRPIVVFQGTECVEYEPDRYPIGKMGAFDTEARVFTLKQIPYAPGRRLYLFTDGLTDQFGGFQARKLTKKRLLEYISSLDTTPLAQQYELIKQFISTWQGQLPQTDDMLLIGVELP